MSCSRHSLRLKLHTEPSLRPVLPRASGQVSLGALPCLVDGAAGCKWQRGAPCPYLQIPSPSMCHSSPWVPEEGPEPGQAALLFSYCWQVLGYLLWLLILEKKASYSSPPLSPSPLNRQGRLPSSGAGASTSQPWSPWTRGQQAP